MKSKICINILKSYIDISKMQVKRRTPGSGQPFGPRRTPPRNRPGAQELPARLPGLRAERAADGRPGCVGTCIHVIHVHLSRSLALSLSLSLSLYIYIYVTFYIYIYIYIYIYSQDTTFCTFVAAAIDVRHASAQAAVEESSLDAPGDGSLPN